MLVYSGETLLGICFLLLFIVIINLLVSVSKENYKEEARFYNISIAVFFIILLLASNKQTFCDVAIEQTYGDTEKVKVIDRDTCFVYVNETEETVRLNTIEFGE